MVSAARGVSGSRARLTASDSATPSWSARYCTIQASDCWLSLGGVVSCARVRVVLTARVGSAAGVSWRGAGRNRPWNGLVASAAAQRAPSGARPQRWHRKASRLLWSYTVESTPAASQGEASTAGTRTPRRSKPKPRSPSGPSGATWSSGGTAAGGGTWSKKPPCSSYSTANRVCCHKASLARSAP